MFGMPGIPCIYYGSEWGCEAVKGSGNDNILRPSFDKPEYNELTYTISSLGQMYHNSRALSYGDYTADEAADVLIDGITGVIAQ